LCAPGSQAESSGATLLYLGTGGPENLDDAGRLDRLIWRYFVIDHPEFGALVLAFTNMVGVMSVTREVNGRIPFSLPTECRRDSAARVVSGATVVVDATAEQLRALLVEGPSDYRALPDPDPNPS
jgi:hypothetical protein